MAAKELTDNKKKNTLGRILFGIGALISLGSGLLNPGSLNPNLSGILIALGIAIGFLNVNLKETRSFLFATITLVIISSLGGAVVAKIPTLGVYIHGVLVSVLTFIIPAGVIVAFKDIFILAED